MKLFVTNFILIIVIRFVTTDANISNLNDYKENTINEKSTPQNSSITINNIEITNDYDFYNVNSSLYYKLIEIPVGSTYNSTNTCVNYNDLINYNYSISYKEFVYRGKIFPENFCYGLLTYNISRNDFFNIIQKNKSTKCLN